MLKTLVVGGAAALVFMTSHAVADGMPRRAPAASVVCCEPNWTGFYIGVGVGGAFATHEQSAKHIFEEKNGSGETTVVDVTETMGPSQWPIARLRHGHPRL